MAVQKLALQTRNLEPQAKTQSEPNFSSHHPASNRAHTTRPLPFPSQPHVESQVDHTSGHKASSLNISPRHVFNEKSKTRQGVSQQGNTYSHDRVKDTPKTHTAPLHTPADITFPSGYSSAEKAAHVARVVADSTGSAVQKLTDSLSEREKLDPYLVKHKHIALSLQL